MSTEILKETTPTPRVTNLKSVSKLIVERLTTDATFRKAFQNDPAAAMRECGVPERLLPDQQLASSIDFISLGHRLQAYETESIAVACVVI
jgi:putative modified peptide